MRYVVDRMTLADIPRVVEIERLAFSTPWPPSAYPKELQENRMAHYIVARDTRLRVVPDTPPSEPIRRPFPLSLLPGRSAHPLSPDAASIIGFAGIWLMVDEAHVTIIASHPEYRGRGAGELLLSSLIGIGYNIQAQLMTLEVRVSNTVAQNLYRKYGFYQTGIRRRYYSDNQEDAMIMSTENIHTQAYIERFTRLRATLAERLERDDQPAIVREDPSAAS
ncbi:MAG: ribosomal protein S18-alanine N-acetyltransferase [Ktedonobacterales bacterium]